MSEPHKISVCNSTTVYLDVNAPLGYPTQIGRGAVTCFNRKGWTSDGTSFPAEKPNYPEENARGFTIELLSTGLNPNADSVINSGLKIVNFSFVVASDSNGTFVPDIDNQFTFTSEFLTLDYSGTMHLKFTPTDSAKNL